MSTPCRPALILAAAMLGSASGAVLAESPRSGITQIYLQRAADGSSVLTDHPSAMAVTERTWQMDREDPVAARQRALDVRRQAEAVSARVQRSIDAQVRQASDDNLLRQRLALAQQQQNDVVRPQGEGDAFVFAPLGFRPRAHRLGNHRPHHVPRSPLHPSPIRGAPPQGF